MIGAQIRTGAICAIIAAVLAGCGSKDLNEKTDLSSLMRQLITTTFSGDKGDEIPADKKTPEEKAAEALRVNPGPLIVVNFEKRGDSQVLAMTGQNGSMRTYMTTDKRALILRGGLLIGTRGFGNDLSVAEVGTESLTRAGLTGKGARIMRYYTGDGQETPLQFDCSTNDGPKPGVTVEDCSGHGISFQNSYISANGNITVSRQWAGPALGYLTIQTLRP